MQIFLLGVDLDYNNENYIFYTALVRKSFYSDDGWLHFNIGGQILHFMSINFYAIVGIQPRSF